MAKWDNMLTILWLLRSRKRVTATEMADRLEISVRTVYRYIDALCASGVPIVAEAGSEGGYSLQTSFREAPLFFDLNELKALAHAVQFAYAAGYPNADDMRKAMEKILERLNQEQVVSLRQLDQGLAVLLSDNDELQRHLQQLDKAVSESRKLDILYRKRDAGAAEARRIRPYAIVYWAEQWYAVAYCEMRESLRTFRVDRIQELRATDVRFERPEDFRVQDVFNKYETTGGGSPETVRLGAGPDILDDLCRHWYLRDCVVANEGDEAVFAVNGESLRGYLPELLLQYGERVRVIAPDILRQILIERSRRLLNHYQT